MFILKAESINCCRVCRSPNQDGDYECLYKNDYRYGEDVMLSEAGILYEELLNVCADLQVDVENPKISLSPLSYPQFLCNSCDLQMKLFKKLKDKAYETVKYFENVIQEFGKNTENIYTCVKEEVSSQYEATQAENDQENVEFEGGNNEYQGNIADEFEESAVHKYSDHLSTTNQDNTFIEYQDYTRNVCQKNTETENQDEINNEACELETHTKQLLVQNCFYTANLGASVLGTSNAMEGDIENITSQEAGISNDFHQTNFKLAIGSSEVIKKTSLNTNENISQLELKMEPVIDKDDYVTEIYELLEDEHKIDNYSENNENIVGFDIYTDDNTESNSALSEIKCVSEGEKHFTSDDEMSQEIQSLYSPKRRRIVAREKEYKCKECELEFKNLKQYKSHRTEAHIIICNICTKQLNSLTALKVHMRLHNGQPAFQCEICQKTFNQRCHYQYHMNHHNNVRNFKCELCKKAFIGKADLKVHMRFHSNTRPYVCKICGKDYLMMEHLKTHVITHTDLYFQCKVCDRKFNSNKNLKMHTRTIHEDEPKFKCTFCMRPFRRKHHLEFHMKKLHEKNIKHLESHNEMIDEPKDANNETNPLCEQDFIENPGYIALSDDIV